MAVSATNDRIPGPLDAATLAARLRAVLAPLSRELRRQARDPLTATQISVLGTIHRHGPLALGTVASLERLSPSRITNVVETLENHGFVERSQDPNDRRSWLVEVTPEAERWIEQGRAIRDAWLAERLQRLDQRELDALAAALVALEHLVEHAE